LKAFSSIDLVYHHVRFALVSVVHEINRTAIPLLLY
jgi:hypothetical protein